MRPEADGVLELAHPAGVPGDDPYFSPILRQYDRISQFLLSGAAVLDRHGDETVADVWAGNFFNKDL